MYPAEEWLIVAGACAATFSYLSGKRLAARKLRGDPYFWVILGPALTFLGILALVGKYQYWSDKVIHMINPFFDRVINALGVGLTQFLIALSVCVFGFAAYVFKEKSQKWYGNVELLVGFFTALGVAGTIKPGSFDLSQFATLAGSAYVIARGFGNRAEGKKKAEKEPRTPTTV
jgi:hypothetical protein